MQQFGRLSEEGRYANSEIIERLNPDVASDELCEETMTEDIQKEFAMNTEITAQKGVFGSKAYSWNEERFFGQDRLEFLERAISEIYQLNFSTQHTCDPLGFFIAEGTEISFQ